MLGRAGMQGILGVVLAPGGRELVLGPLVGRAGSRGHCGLGRSLVSGAVPLRT